MAKLGGTLRNVFVWTYSRGTIPYDIICALILLFIFLAPRGCFLRRPAVSEPHSSAHREGSPAVHAAIQPAGGGIARR